MLDQVRGNASMLSGLSKIKQIVEAVCVKLILADPSEQQHKGAQTEQSCFVATFRVYRNTQFSDIQKAACEFWQLIDQ